MLSRLFCNILADSVDETARFYETVFGLSRSFDSDWFVLLTHPDNQDLQYGVIRRDADIVPEAARSDFGGAMISFVVEDCRTAFAVATGLGAETVEPPTLMPYGQLRALVRDPSGALVDISSPEG